MSSWSEIGQSGVSAPKIQDVLRLEEVRCVRRGRRVIDRVSLSVRPGDLVVLDGARGTGKSILLAISAAALRPDRGGVYIGGRNVQALQQASLPYVRRNVGYLPADPQLLHHETVRENVLLALAVRGFDKTEAHEHAEAVLQAVGVRESMGAIVSELSMGERRLVALARALAGAPAVIVLDDPVAGLTATDRQAVKAAIETACQSSAAVLCATADPVFAGMLVEVGAEKVTLSEGRLVGAVPRMHVLAGGPADEATSLQGPRAVESPIADSGEIEELDDADLESFSS